MCGVKNVTYKPIPENQKIYREKALEKVGYKGWMTIEGSGELTLQEKNERLDLIFRRKTGNRSGF